MITNAIIILKIRFTSIICTIFCITKLFDMKYINYILSNKTLHFILIVLQDGSIIRVFATGSVM